MLHIGEGGVLFGVSIIATIEVLTVGPEGLLAAPIFIVTAAVGLDFAMFGYQEIAYGINGGAGAEPDPIPLIHLFFPDYLE